MAYRCHGVTLKDMRCQRWVIGDRYCHDHQDQRDSDTTFDDSYRARIRYQRRQRSRSVEDRSSSSHGRKPQTFRGSDAPYRRKPDPFLELDAPFRRKPDPFLELDAPFRRKPDPFQKLERRSEISWVDDPRQREEIEDPFLRFDDSLKWVDDPFLRPKVVERKSRKYSDLRWVSMAYRHH